MSLTWTCHVCGLTRPDPLISVYTSTKMIGTIPVQQNVRYCNDNQACIDGARGVNFLESKETDERVPNIEPDLITRFKWRADRRCRKLNDGVRFPFYRWEVCDWLDGRWAVVAMQNVASGGKNG